MTEEQGYVLETALDLDFKMINNDGDVFECTEQQLLQFAQRIANWTRLDSRAFYRVGNAEGSS